MEIVILWVAHHNGFNQLNYELSNRVICVSNFERGRESYYVSSSSSEWYGLLPTILVHLVHKHPKTLSLNGDRMKESNNLMINLEQIQKHRNKSFRMQAESGMSL